MKLAILCSGQAGQHPGMMDDILAAKDCTALRTVASEVLGQDIETWWRGLNESEIFANANAQFAIALYQIATWQRVAPLLPTPPALVAGYSLGEVLAWHVTGAMDAEKTLRLVRKRAALMDRCVTDDDYSAGCMVLWRGRNSPSNRELLERAIQRHGLVTAIYRPGGELVLGGPVSAIEKFLADVPLQPADLKRLRVTVPSHTPWLAQAIVPFRNALDESMCGSVAFPVVSGIDGAILRSRDQAVDILPRQIAESLHWDWCLDTLASFGIDRALELGPGTDLAKIVERYIPGAFARSVEEFACADEIASWLSRNA